MCVVYNSANEYLSRKLCNLPMFATPPIYIATRTNEIIVCANGHRVSIPRLIDFAMQYM
jgi:hypothetical protein